MAKPKQLDWVVVRRIRQQYASGEKTQTELADEFQISQSTVCKIVNNYIHKQSEYLEVCGSADVRLGLKYGNKR